MNASQQNVSLHCELNTKVTSILFPCLYTALFLAALVLNCLAVWIFFQIRSSSTFVVYLKNVVVADLLMTLTLPIKVLGDTGLGPVSFRTFHCRYSGVLFYTTMYISILLLGLISLDRYLKIVRPFGKCALQRVGVGQAVCACVWAVMVSLSLPNVILTDKKPPVSASGRLKCSKMKSELGLQWHEGFNYLCQVVFWGTLGLMAVCYTFISRKVYQSYQASKSSSGTVSKRTKSKVFVVVGVFFVCFAPFHFTRVPYTLSQTRGTSAHCWAQNQLFYAKEITLWLSATNICLDPLIYVFLCRVFRRKLTATLTRKPLANGGLESHTETSTKQDPSHIVQTNKSLELRPH